MKIGMVLLDEKNNYVYNDGKLPGRPAFDKTLLLDMAKGRKILCSKNTLLNLPLSILEIGIFITDPNEDYDLNWGIDTFKEIPELLMVTRGKYMGKPGKVFRMDNYRLIYKDKGGLELWTTVK